MEKNKLILFVNRGILHLGIHVYKPSSQEDRRIWFGIWLWVGH